MVENFNSVVILLFDFFHHKVVFIPKVLACKTLHHCNCYVGCYLVLESLIVYNFAFKFTSLNCLKLSSHCGVSKGYYQSSVQSYIKITYYCCSDKYHSGIENSHITLNTKSSIFFNFCQTHEHVCARYFYLIENCPAIIFTVVAKFRTYITCSNTFKMFKSMKIS